MLEKTTITETYTLLPNQYLTDLNLEFSRHRYFTHLEAPTGTGKSTLVLDQLSNKHKIIMAVPQRAQVEQLKAIYSDSKKHYFIHGDIELPDNLDQYSAIVTTYDGLNRFHNRISQRHYMLVIDEAHKLYQAAGYRPDAVTKLVNHTLSKHFIAVVTLSAKLNPELMPFAYSRIIKVEAEPKEKLLDLHLFKSFARLREQLLRARPTAPGQLVVMRVNNKNQIDECAEYYQRQDLKVLKVTSDRQKTDEVLQTFATELISDEYDLVLTTSLMDEAININNTNIESVHILGDRINSEELLQFTGRFRKKIPPFHQYLTESMLDKPKISLDEQREYLTQMAEALQLVHDRSLPVYGPQLNIIQLNKLSETQYGVPLLCRVEVNDAEARIEINRTAINNRLYQLDTNNHYHSKNTLVSKYKRTIPGIKIVVTEDNTAEASEAFMESLQDVQLFFQEKRQKLIDHCAEQIGYEDVQEEYKHQEMLDDYCATTDPETEEGKLARLWQYLSRNCLQHQSQIKMVLEQSVEQKVIHYVDHAKHNPLVLAMLLEMKRIPIDTVMDLDEAKGKMIKGLQQLFKLRPDIKKLLRLQDDRGNIWIKENNHIEISDRLVRKFYKEFTNTEVVRSNSEYKFRFQSAYPFDLRYRLDYLKYHITSEGEMELLRRVSSTTHNKLGFKVGSPKPKRKQKI